MDCLSSARLAFHGMDPALFAGEMRHTRSPLQRFGSATGAWLLLAVLAGGVLPLGSGARAGDPDVYTNSGLTGIPDADPDVYNVDHAALDTAAHEWASEIASETAGSAHAETIVDLLLERLSDLCHAMFLTLGF